MSVLKKIALSVLIVFGWSWSLVQFGAMAIGSYYRFFFRFNQLKVVYLYQNKPDRLLEEAMGATERAVFDFFYTQQRIPGSELLLKKFMIEHTTKSLSQENIAMHSVFESSSISYTPVDSERYRLCANFQRDTRALDTYSTCEGNKAERFWHHPAGKYCFELQGRYGPPGFFCATSFMNTHPIFFIEPLIKKYIVFIYKDQL
jgi:hypothetical protein